MLLIAESLIMVNSYVSELQNEFFRRLETVSNLPPSQVPCLLREIVECDMELVEFTLGSIGHNLKLFSQHVDLSHPEMTSILDGMLSDNQEFSQKCVELLHLGKYAREKHLNKLIPYFGKIIVDENNDKNIIRKIDVPQNNRMHVRLLKNCSDRDNIRLTKRTQIIDLNSFGKKAEEIWESQPDNFRSFLRFDVAYQEDLIVAERKVKRYKDLGCESLANEIQASIDAFKKNMDQCYYGFNRITMTNASIILAKSLGFKFVLSQDIMNGNSTSRIVVYRNFFGNYNFDPDNLNSEIFSAKENSCFSYEPRLYPLHELAEIMTDNVKKTIDVLENFPDAGNKPIFDHFGVIVPSVNFPFEEKNNSYTILNESGIIQSYSSKKDAVKSLDCILIRGEYFHPILVGEKDNKCYFISYWT